MDSSSPARSSAVSWSNAGAMPATQPDDMPAAFEQAFNTGDIDQIVALYEPDAVLVPQPGQVVRGLSAIREALQGFLALKLPIHLEGKRVLVLDEIALVSSTWKMS